MSQPFPEQVTPGGILIYPQMQSPDYVPGVSGWAIFSNGTVEFNSGTFRGTVTAGTFEGTDFVINPAGFFAYSGTPAANSLLLSIAPAAGTDPYGNAYPQGAAIYRFDAVAGEYVKADLDESGIRAFTAATQAGPWIEVSGVTVQAQASGPPWLLNVGSGSARAAVRFLDPVYGGIPASEPGSPLTTETWHNLTLVAGFAAGSRPARYRYYADNTVRLTGQVKLTAAAAAGAAFATLPAGYVPAALQDFSTPNTLSGYTLGGGSVYCNSAGNLGINPAGSSGNFVDLDGIVIALD